MAEWKSAPARVRRVAAGGTLPGVIVFLSSCASAFGGHVGWGRALASGVLQFFLFSVVGRLVLGAGASALGLVGAPRFGFASLVGWSRPCHADGSDHNGGWVCRSRARDRF